MISKFSQKTNISNKILYTSMKANCYTKDILYSSHIKNASTCIRDTRKIIPRPTCKKKTCTPLVHSTLPFNKNQIHWDWRNSFVCGVKKTIKNKVTVARVLNVIPLFYMYVWSFDLKCEINSRLDCNFIIYSMIIASFSVLWGRIIKITCLEVKTSTLFCSFTFLKHLFWGGTCKWYKTWLCTRMWMHTGLGDTINWCRHLKVSRTNMYNVYYMPRAAFYFHG